MDTRQNSKAHKAAQDARNDLKEARAWLCHGPRTPRYLKKVARRARRRADRNVARQALRSFS